MLGGGSTPRLHDLILRVRAALGGGEVAPVPVAAVLGELTRRRYTVGPLQVDIDGHHVFVDGKEIHLSAIEMRLLVYLILLRGRVCARQDLLQNVWGYRPDVPSRTVDAHIKHLRSKLGAARALVETVRGSGYRLSDGHPVLVEGDL